MSLLQVSALSMALVSGFIEHEDRHNSFQGFLLYILLRELHGT